MTDRTVEYVTKTTPDLGREQEVDHDVATSAEEFRQKVLAGHHKSATNFTN